MWSFQTLVSVFAFGCLASTPPSSAEAPSAKEDYDRSVIEEIIVTATRREASLASVPLSVNVLTEKQLQDLGASHFQDYARTVPGLYFSDSGFGGEKHTIRGISTAVAGEINPATSVYLDDIPITHAGGDGLPYSPDPALVDIRRIEVLRGPQGTLFGASSMGGALRIITNGPNLAAHEGFLQAGMSTYKDGGSGYDLRGMLNVPLADGRAALRGVAYVTDADGYIDNPALGVENVNSNELRGGRLAATWSVSEHITVDAKAVYQSRKSDGTDVDELDDPDRTQSRMVPEPNEDQWSLYNVVLTANLDWGTLVSSTGYIDRTIDTRIDVTDFLGFFFDTGTTLTAINSDDVEEFTQEVRFLDATGGRVDWLFGGFFQDQSLNFRQDFPSPGFDAATGGLASAFGPGDNLYSALTEVGLEQIALFGDLTLRLSDRFEVSAGARWFEIDRGYDLVATGLFNGGPSTARGDASESGVSPKLSLTYTPSDDFTVYASAAKGFRPGGVNSPAASDLPECVDELTALGFSEFPIEYDSDELWSYEVGARTRWADGKIDLSAAAYHIDWSDMQTVKVLECTVLFIENVGSASNDGLELSLAAKPADNAEIRVTATYINAELAEDVPNLGGRKGDPIPGVPNFTAAVGINYFPSWTGRLDDMLHVDYQYVDSSYNDFASATRLRMPAYDTANLRYSLFADRWTATLFVNNVFDEKGLVFIADDALGRWQTTIPPRQLGFNLRRSF